MRLLSLATLAIAPSLVFSIRVPNSDTPLFYLSSSSQSASADLPVTPSYERRLKWWSSLTGPGPIGKFYFAQGKLVAVDPNGPPQTPNPTLTSLISATLGPTGCTTAGALVFVQSSSSNKCARQVQPGQFVLQSDQENSQLGASLVPTSGAFYACGSDVWYKGPVDDGPAGCNPISLYTVPVLPVGS
ncbi:GPI-anchored small secreted protein [Infundibulicybe gibba]|nr:GPI-anchored small secreted protein [Infundibulicybe gibba]